MLISQPSAYRLAVCSLLALIFISLAWELWLSPLRPGGSWLALKALPPCLLLPGILRRQRRTFLLGGMLVLFYTAESIVRLFDAQPISRYCAMAATVASWLFFLSCVLFIRAGRQGQS